MRSTGGPLGMVRFRRAAEAGSPWRVDLFGPACHLEGLAA